MHWSKMIIALKAQQRTLQIFDLSQKQKLKSAVMNEDVVFWKWISETSLGLVTDTSVYHWDVFDQTQNAPVKVFDRNAKRFNRALQAGDSQRRGPHINAAPVGAEVHGHADQVHGVIARGQWLGLPARRNLSK